MNTNYYSCPPNIGGGHIQAIWQMSGNPPYKRETILPKGKAELIFSFSENVMFSKIHQSESFLTPRCFVNGLNDSPISLLAPKHQFFFGVVLKPIAFKSLLGVPAGEFLNSIVDLTLINNEFNFLWEKLAEAKSFDERIEIVLAWAVRRSGIDHNREHALSEYLNSSIETNTVSNLSAHFCYSSRQLNRKAYSLFGLSTETLIRYKRYITSINKLHNEKAALTGIGLDSGYYDQAHFIREFKEFTGFTPGEYRRIKSSMPAHVYC